MVRVCTHTHTTKQQHKTTSFLVDCWGLGLGLGRVRVRGAGAAGEGEGAGED
jgi:hypothetical protein